jgi:hypothetical protein
MNAKFLRPSAARNAAKAPTGSGAAAAGLTEDTGGPVGQACCCPARPAVRVVMPPGTPGPRSTELLLCGHHYRVSRAALADARAVVSVLPGMPEDVASWIELDGSPDWLG